MYKSFVSKFENTFGHTDMNPMPCLVDLFYQFVGGRNQDFAAIGCLYFE